MARLRMQSEGWFCPTADELLPLIVGRISMEQTKPFVLDPSCGDGRVAAYLAEAWGGFSYGNELNSERYSVARGRLFKCTKGPQESLQVNGLFDVVYINPPYDYSEDVSGSRIELVHARAAAKWLRTDGLLIALVPEHVATSKAWRQWLGPWFYRHEIYRAPEPIYERDGKQVVVFALKRQRYETYGSHEANVIRHERLGDETRPRIKVADQTWNRTEPMVFRNVMPSGERILATLEGFDPLAAAEFKNLVLPPPSQTHFRPVLPPRPGHLAQLIAVGVLNGKQVELHGEPFIIKGTSEKKVELIIEESEDGSSKTTEIERPAWQIHLLSAKTGQLRAVSSDSSDYGEFLSENLNRLLATAQESAPPLYDGDYGHLIPYFDYIHSPRELPGRPENGLLTAQKHIVAGLHELYKVSRSAMLVGEMGTGKTCAAIALTLIEMLEAGMDGQVHVPSMRLPEAIRRLQEAENGIRHPPQRAQWPRVVVMAPAVVAPKWVEEVESVLREYGAKGFLIGEERRQQHCVPKRMTLPEAIKHLTQVERDVLCDRYVWRPAISERVKIAKPIADIQRAWAYEGPAFLVLTYNTAKDGSRWEHAPTTRKHHRRARVPVEGEVGILKEEPTTDEFHACPICGHIPKDENGIPWGRRHFHDGQGRKQRRCPKKTCRAKLFQYVPYKKGGKWPSATFISQHYAGEYFLVVDELHNSAGSDTDIGRAMARLAFNSRWNLGLTGTIINGFASSLFHLLHRFDHEFRMLYLHTEVKLFEAHHGLTKKITVRRRRRRETGAYGYDRWEETTYDKPSPGVTPAMAAMMLRQSAFLSLAEIGVELPPYQEFALPVTLYDGTEDWDDLKRGLDVLGDIHEAAKLAMMLSEGKAMGAFSKYIWASLGWLDCPAAETIKMGERESSEYYLPHCPVPAGGFPKDRAVIELIIDRLNQGRGVAVFFEQVHRRPAWPRIQDLLEDKGVRPFILKASIKAEERMPHIWEYVRAVKGDHPPVMLGNGALVKEGVDLLDFPTIVEFGQSYRINEVRQRDRRSWRLGQDKPVEVVFAYYEDTEQQRALYHIAAKLRAAHQIEGEVGNGIAAQFSETSFMQDLMARAQGAELPKVSDFLQTVVIGDGAHLRKPKPIPTIVETPVVQHTLFEIKMVDVKGGHQQASFF